VAIETTPNPEVCMSDNLFTIPPDIETRWATAENPKAERGAATRGNDGRKRTPSVNPVKAGASWTLAEATGRSGTVRRIWVTIPDRSPKMLRGIRLDMYWDGATTPAVSAPLGDFFCTVTGNRDVIGREQFLAMKDGAVVANAGHFDVELDLAALDELAPERRRIRPALDERKLADGRRIYVLAEGRLVNLAAAEGHPADVMDLSFADQALSAEHLLSTAGRALAVGVHAVPPVIDREVARLKLRALGVEIDTLTVAQRDYLGGWHTGT